MSTIFPFRADHVGSLLRPKKLLNARQKWREGVINTAELIETEDDLISEVIKKQEEIGLKSVTDGEWRRDYWHLDFMWKIKGVVPSADFYTSRFSEADFVAKVAEVIGRVAYPKEGIMREAFKFLFKNTKQTAKFCMPSAAQFRFREGVRISNKSIYDDPSQFWKDIGEVYKNAVSDYAALGCRYVQIDDVNTALLCDSKIRAGFEKYGGNIDDMLDVNIQVNNATLSNKPTDMWATAHLCRGNFMSTFAGTGGYERIAKSFLKKMNVNAFFMEFDDQRSGDFSPLRFLPKDKYVVIGIMSSKNPELESKEQLKSRINDATKYVPVEQICISPQCGFASTKEGNLLTESQQWKKLERLVAVADEVWG